MFRCLGCEAILWRPRPFCPRCLLVSAGTLPTRVGTLTVFSLYWMVGSTHRALVGWKKNRGTLSDRTVMASDRIDALVQALHTTWAGGAPALVPVPQAFERSVALKGSPAQDFAHALSRRSGFRVLEALSIEPGGEAQAERSLVDRLSASHRFAPAKVPTARAAFLVDDFVTTGKTLENAARVLTSQGTQVLGALTIGLRPRRTEFPLERAPTPDPRRPRDNESAHPSY